MLPVCWGEAGGSVLHKPETRHDSSRTGRRNGALSACSHSLCLAQTLGSCRAADTRWNKFSECWASVQSTAMDEKREESTGLFWLVVSWGNCTWNFGFCCIVGNIRGSGIQWLLPCAPEGILLWRDRSVSGESSGQSQRNAKDKVSERLLEFIQTNSWEKPSSDVEIEEKAA